MGSGEMSLVLLMGNAIGHAQMQQPGGCSGTVKVYAGLALAPYTASRRLHDSVLLPQLPEAYMTCVL